MTTLPCQTVADLYDIVYETRSQDSRFYSDLIDRVIGRKPPWVGSAAQREVPEPGVLEVGAGTGRVLLPIAARHRTVRFTGTDLDPDQLAVLRRHADELGLANVATRLGDVLDLPYIDAFDVVTAPFRVLQHCLSLQDLATALTNMARALRAGGVLAFDLFNPSIPVLAATGVLAQQSFTAPSGAVVDRLVVVNDRSYLDQSQLVEESYEVHQPWGERLDFMWTYRTRYTFKGEVEPLVREAGLHVHAVYSDFTGTPFGQGPYPGDIVVVATKPYPTA